MPLDPVRRRQVQQVFQQFLRDRARSIRNLNIEKLNINPFLIRILARELGLNDAKSIVAWLFSQRLERGIVTSFGKALEKAAKVFSEGTRVEGADVFKTKSGRHHHIQVKSGPNTVPKDLAIRITQLLQSAQRRNAGSVPLFRVFYTDAAHIPTSALSLF